MDGALTIAAEEFKLQWDHTKDCKNVTHLGVNLDGKKHRRYREAKARTAFPLVRGLTRLPPRENKKIIVSQVLPVLINGSPRAVQESGTRLSRMGKMAWRGSRVADIAGVAELDVAMKSKRVRWAVSVYDRAIPALKEVSEQVLRKELPGGTALV